LLNQLLKVLEDHKPDYIAVATDSKEKTFRHDKYEAYKATREGNAWRYDPTNRKDKRNSWTDEYSSLYTSRYEADDIIGTVVKLAEKKGMISYAITPDKDYMQLVTEKTIVAKPGRGSDEVVFFDVKK